MVPRKATSKKVSSAAARIMSNIKKIEKLMEDIKMVAASALGQTEKKK